MRLLITILLSTINMFARQSNRSYRENKFTQIWLIQPILFVCALYYLNQNPDTVMNAMPDFTLLSSRNNNISNLIQRPVTNIYSAWRLGQLSCNNNNNKQ